MADDRDRLFAATATADNGAGLRAVASGGLVTVTPLTPEAEAWLRASVDAEATWQGDQLVLELRYFPDLAEAAIAAGFTFERNALPN